MKVLITCFLVSIIMFSCYEMKRVELTDEVKEELSLVKPMNITDAEISAVANDIGDEIVGKLSINNDTIFKVKEHKVRIIGQDNLARQDSILKLKFEAYAYSLAHGKRDLPALVKFKSRSEFAQYEKVILLTDSTFKMVLIDVAVRETTKRIAQERKKKK